MEVNREMDRVAELWPFTRKNYPMLDLSSREEQARHIVLHQAKDAGRMAAAVEPYDHGRTTDEVLLRRSTRNTLVNALRLCDLYGWSPAALLVDYEQEVAR